jgi:hypothetical protein
MSHDAHNAVVEAVLVNLNQLTPGRQVTLAYQLDELVLVFVHRQHPIGSVRVKRWTGLVRIDSLETTPFTRAVPLSLPSFSPQVKKLSNQ